MALRLTEDQYKDFVSRNKGMLCKAALLPETPVEAEKKPRMNKTERRYQTEKLEPAMHDGKITSFAFEALKFRLAGKTFYTPDFGVMRNDGVFELHEVKGGWIQEDAMIKFKVAAEMYPYFRWKMWQWKGGVWTLIRNL